MTAVKPESPLVVEEILLLWGYRVTYKDKWVCVMDTAFQPAAKPICIPQDVDHEGAISVAVMQQILSDTKLDYFNYFALLKKVKGEEPEHKA